MIKGKHVGLRAVEESDLPSLERWRNDAAMRRFYREYRELNMEDQRRWFHDICCGNKRFCMFAIESVDEVALGGVGVRGGELIGACGLTNIDWVIRSAELSFYIGAGGVYVDDVCAPECVTLMTRYAFEILGMNKVWAEIYEYDEAKKNLFEGMKMHLDGVLRDNAFDAGRHWDSLVYSLLASEYEERSR